MAVGTTWATSSSGRRPVAWAPRTGTRCWPRCAGPCPCGTLSGETSSQGRARVGTGARHELSSNTLLCSLAGTVNAGVPRWSPQEPSWSLYPGCGGGTGPAGCLGTQGCLPLRTSRGLARARGGQPGIGPLCSHFELPNRPVPWPWGGLGLSELPTSHPCWETMHKDHESWRPGAVQGTGWGDTNKAQPLGVGKTRSPCPGDLLLADGGPST